MGKNLKVKPRKAFANSEFFKHLADFLVYEEHAKGEVRMAVTGPKIGVSLTDKAQQELESFNQEVSQLFGFQQTSFFSERHGEEDLEECRRASNTVAENHNENGEAAGRPQSAGGTLAQKHVDHMRYLATNSRIWFVRGFGDFGAQFDFRMDSIVSILERQTDELPIAYSFYANGALVRKQALIRKATLSQAGFVLEGDLDAHLENSPKISIQYSSKLRHNLQNEKGYVFLRTEFPNKGSSIKNMSPSETSMQLRHENFVRAQRAQEALAAKARAAEQKAKVIAEERRKADILYRNEKLRRDEQKKVERINNSWFGSETINDVDVYKIGFLTLRFGRED